MKQQVRRAAAATPVAVSMTGLLLGIVAWLAGSHEFAGLCWSTITAFAIPLVAASLIDGLRHGRLGVDIIALMALAGALLYHQPLAGALIATMFTTGQGLEAFAQARARSELKALLARAPQTVNRYQDSGVVATAAGEIRAGDRLLVKPGEVLAVDGVVQEHAALLDESALTGESMPVERRPGAAIMSGAVNAGGPLDMVATADTERSTYASIVRLVREAEASKAPLVRLADRYALIFVPVTLVMAAAAWLISGDPVRALAVLVVATPCPLILAAPVAIVSGISRAAGLGIIVKSGAALETLGRARLLLFDKTGTLTAGRPVLDSVETFGAIGAATLLRMSASLDQVSSHVLASAMVEAARKRGSVLLLPTDVREEPGAGIIGRVGPHTVALGKRSWVAPNADAIEEKIRLLGHDGRSIVFCAIDGQLAGALHFEDPVRPEAPATVAGLREAGIAKMLMLTGDQAAVAERVGADVGLDGTLAGLSPAGKIDAVRLTKQEGVTVMVGDGINDAPALAAADVGVAMGARGATASSEAADVVLLVDRLDRLSDAIQIARRARTIALQSVLIGMGLSITAMVAALAGLLPPAAGALFQEAIDLAVVVNALRALTGGRSPRTVTPTMPEGCDVPAGAGARTPRSATGRPGQ